MEFGKVGNIDQRRGAGVCDVCVLLVFLAKHLPAECGGFQLECVDVRCGGAVCGSGLVPQGEEGLQRTGGTRGEVEE